MRIAELAVAQTAAIAVVLLLACWAAGAATPTASTPPVRHQLAAAQLDLVHRPGPAVPTIFFWISASRISCYSKLSLWKLVELSLWKLDEVVTGDVGAPSCTPAPHASAAAPPPRTPACTRPLPTRPRPVPRHS
nr:unnamed protein product [Digitaria exilis]